jgi:hypothetical protein
MSLTGMCIFSSGEKAFSIPSASCFGVDVYDRSDAHATISAIRRVRCIALWKMCHSRLYDGTTVENENSEGEYSPINKYMIALAIASFFIIKGLALVYKNYNLILGL